MHEQGRRARRGEDQDPVDIGGLRECRVLIPTLNSGPIPSDATFEALATCPNRNWTKDVVEGSKQIQSFTYTVTFGTIQPNGTFVAAFPGPYLTITGT